MFGGRCWAIPPALLPPDAPAAPGATVPAAPGVVVLGVALPAAEPVVPLAPVMSDPGARF